MRRILLLSSFLLAVFLAACQPVHEPEKITPEEVTPEPQPEPQPEPEPEPEPEPQPVFMPHELRAKVDFDKNPAVGWTEGFKAWTIDRLAGFTAADDPQTDIYGGWTIRNLGGSGFFRVEKAEDRWWIVDPLGNIFLSKGVTAFSQNRSARSIARRTELFGGGDGGQTGYYGWLRQETSFLKSIGFNSLGAWSLPQAMHSNQYMPYAMILSPMQNYNGELKNSGREAAAYQGAKSWEGYPYDFAMVFDEGFDAKLETVLAEAATYRDDPNLIGYFIDNELPWKDYALEMCLTRWPSGHINHRKAQEWLDARKGHAGALYSEADQDDKNAFIAYCYEVYLQKVTTVLRKYDPNHMFLGNRFNQWSYELQNEAMFRTAGRYIDIISINYYRKWQPEQETMRNWTSWSGRPFLITEFYVKGEDATLADPTLTNRSGAGWVVPTQDDRGLFYQNFVIELLKSDACVGWHWFRYMDNDPEDTTADASNRNANKGIVKWNFERYDDLVRHMQEINGHAYQLARFFHQ